MGAPRCYVAITTYDRPKLIDQITAQVREEEAAAGVDCQLMVYEDHVSRSTPIEYVESVRERADFYWHADRHYGKRKYWRLVNNVLADAQEFDFDYFFFLDDDLELVDGFFRRAIRSWRAIVAHDPKLTTLNLILTPHREGRGLWGAGEPDEVLYEHDGERHRFWRTNWTDCIFMAGSDFTMIVPEIPPVPYRRWTRRPDLGSGVGQRITKQIRREGGTQYQVSESLVRHGDHPSKMNPKIRENESMAT